MRYEDGTKYKIVGNHDGNPIKSETYILKISETRNFKGGDGRKVGWVASMEAQGTDEYSQINAASNAFRNLLTRYKCYATGRMEEVE